MYIYGGAFMDDIRKTDRRKNNKEILQDRRRGPRRLVCGCGGIIEVRAAAKGRNSFICLRCGKKQ
jgi:hypothetical protein